ncbi:MAG: primosomal protein N' [Prevotellaceae bacterium]|jgi:primosomal protein N' (replication factor Y)|nr:primosomal protein N' [Prevotellaceae bacterium]
MQTPQYADIILPLPLANVFTYAVPPTMRATLAVGMRVILPVQRKIYTGIVYSVHAQQPEGFEAREIISVLDERPIVRRPQLQFWEWIAGYYQCFLGDVYKAALPSGLKLESETQVALLPDFEEKSEQFSDKDWRVIDAIRQTKTSSIKELEKLLDTKNLLPRLKSLLEKQAIVVNEAVLENYRPRREDFVRLHSNLHNEERLKTVFKEIGRSKKQVDLLLFYLDASQVFGQKPPKEISRRALLKASDISSTILRTLVDKGILEIYQKEISRLDFSVVETRERHALNSYQEKAYGEILYHFRQKNTVLLHGVTSSGKTEIYIRLIEETLRLGRQALYLLPEIALTAQLTERLKQVFGNRLGVYHSKFADAERVEIWNNLLRNEGYEIILGVRSSIFLPFRDLGLVIVDEEHETSYKQFDPAPRYHARNAAIVLASMHGAKTLLGSATPSIESYNNALTGKFGLVELTQRYADIALPEIVAVDTKELRRKRQMKTMYSPLLLEKIEEALTNNEQVILFQNRRGYAPYLECTACATVPRCKNCDVSLTVHKAFNALTCHYCGYTKPIPARCPDCGGELTHRGFGTERINDEIGELFPQARIARMDLDTTRTKTAYEKIIADFEQHKIDILIGTQMISKGLDFERVSLVGIINADNLLNYPDFRAHERAFQLMAQVSGRAGRKGKRGMVILQTSNPSHPVIQQVIANDYKAMFRQQMQERELFKYPPYFRLIYINVRHRDLQIVNKAANYMAERLRAVFGSRVLGPDNPPVTRIQNFFIKRIVLKIEADASNEEAKRLINTVSEQVRGLDLFKSLQIGLDVDPA